VIDTLSELSVIRQIQNVENVDHTRRSDERFILFYSESRKRELKTKPIYECRSDERLKTKSERSARLSYTEFCCLL
jgi:TnpA family transposase